MAMTPEDKANVVASYATGANDTGSAEVQVALLTARIQYLTEHVKIHKQDHSSRRGLIKLVGQRRRLLRFVENDSEQRYRDLITRLGIRR
jgi:small subunit ribosomal protein S15